MQNWLNMSWKILVLRGVVGIVFGIVAMVWPLNTALALALLWGLWALVDSIGSFIQAFESGTPGAARVLLVLMGLVALVAAVFAITSPGVAAVTLTWILGIWLIVRGVFEAVGAFFADGGQAKLLLLASGIVDVLLGILFAANPGRATIGIAWLLGLIALVWGVIFVVAGVVARKEAKAFDAAGGTLV